MNVVLHSPSGVPRYLIRIVHVTYTYHTVYLMRIMLHLVHCTHHMYTHHTVYLMKIVHLDTLTRQSTP